MVKGDVMNMCTCNTVLKDVDGFIHIYSQNEI